MIEEIFSTCSRYRGHVPFIFDHSSHHCLCVRFLFCLGECMYHILGRVQLEALCALKNDLPKKLIFLVHLVESQAKVSLMFNHRSNNVPIWWCFQEPEGG